MEYSNHEQLKSRKIFALEDCATYHKGNTEWNYEVVLESINQTHVKNFTVIKLNKT